jgi:hypothetical protein
MKYYFFNEPDLPFISGEKVNAIIYDLENNSLELFLDITYISSVYERGIEEFTFKFIRDGKLETIVKPYEKSSYSVLAHGIEGLIEHVSKHIIAHTNNITARCEDLEIIDSLRWKRSRDAELHNPNKEEVGEEEIIDYGVGDTIYALNGFLSAGDPIIRTITKMYTNAEGTRCMEFEELSWPSAMFTTKTFAAGKSLGIFYNNTLYAVSKEVEERRQTINNINSRKKQYIQIMSKLIANEN